MEFVFWSVVKDKSAAAAKKAKKRLDKADGRNKLMRLSKLTDGVMVGVRVPIGQPLKIKDFHAKSFIFLYLQMRGVAPIAHALHS